MRWSVLFLLLWVSLGHSIACEGCSSIPEPEPAPLPNERIESGFVLERDAFSFSNYGGTHNSSKIDSELLVRLYGESDVCLGQSSTCRVRPVARKFMQAVNDSMRGGRCEGFAVLAGLLHRDKVDKEPLGASQTRDMTLADNRPLHEEIAYWFMTQYLPDVLEQSTDALDAQSVVRRLSSSWAGDDKRMFRIGILRLDENNRLTGGHALLPIAIEPGSGDGEYVIDVYDNNHPLEARQIVVNTITNEWQYEASINPEASSALYLGNPQNGNLMYLAELDARVGTHPCTFCDDETGEERLQQVFGSGGVQFSVSTEDGQQSGELQGRLLQEIPGSTCVPLLSADNYVDDAPIHCRFSRDTPMDLRIQPSGTDAQYEAQQVQMHSADFSMSIEQLGLNAEEEARVRIFPQSHALAFTPPPRSALPSGQNARLWESGPQLSAFVRRVDTGDDVEVVMRLPGEGVNEGRLQVDSGTGNPTLEIVSLDDQAPVDTVTVSVTLAGEEGELTFTGEVPVSSAGATELRIDIWEGEGEPVAAEIDTDGDGEADYQEPIADQGEVTEPPTAPSALELAVESASIVLLSWQDNDETETGFELERNDGDGFFTEAFLPPNTTQYRDATLLRATSYAYRVRAINGYGASAYTDVLSYESPPCSPGEAWEQGDCVVCSAGFYCVGGTSGAEPCGVGTYDDDADPTTACAVCQAGEYCEGANAQPQSCAAGFYDEDSDAATPCQACAAGTHCPGGPAPASSCAPGTEDEDQNAATPCRVCEAGEFCAGAAARTATCGNNEEDRDRDPTTPCTACADGLVAYGGRSFCNLGAPTCGHVKQLNPQAQSGVYPLRLNPFVPELTSAYCDMELGGGGWTLVAQRRGQELSNGVEACGENVLDFMNRPCGDVQSLGPQDSYSFGAERGALYPMEMLVAQFDPAGNLDVDDAYIVTLAYEGQELFEPDLKDPLAIQSFAVEKVCDIDGVNCDRTDPVWRLVEEGYFDAAGCSMENAAVLTPAIDPVPGGMYGLCHDGTSLLGPAYEINSLYGDRSGFAEAKVWNSDSPSDPWMERIFFRSIVQLPSSCAAIQIQTPQAPDGEYEIDVDGTGPLPALSVYCDMTTDGGGYTYFPVENGQSTSNRNDANDCQDVGMDLAVPRTQAHWQSLFAFADARNAERGTDLNYFHIVPGIFNPNGGQSYVDFAMNSADVADWTALDGGNFWLRDTPYTQPDGNYTQDCWLGLLSYDPASLTFADSDCDYAATHYICSTNDKDPIRDCAPGTYNHDANDFTGCEVCVPGSFCPGGSYPEVICPAGSWDDDQDVLTPCLACSNGVYCEGGIVPPAPCANGSTDHDGDPATPCSAE